MEESSPQTTNLLTSWISNDCYFFQIILAFLLGILFSPWSMGFIIFVAGLFIYEVVLSIYTGPGQPGWRIDVRFAIIIASIVGFLLGRLVIGFDNIFE